VVLVGNSTEWRNSSGGLVDVAAPAHSQAEVGVALQVAAICSQGEAAQLKAINDAVSEIKNYLAFGDILHVES